MKVTFKNTSLSFARKHIKDFLENAVWQDNKFWNTGGILASTSGYKSTEVSAVGFGGFNVYIRAGFGSSAARTRYAGYCYAVDNNGVNTLLETLITSTTADGAYITLPINVVSLKICYDINKISSPICITE